MTINLTTQEIANYRSQLANFEEALIALDAIEDCEGNIEDAAIALAIQVGQQPDRLDWLPGLAKRLRVGMCESIFREELLNNQIASAVEHLLNSDLCPKVLVAPAVIYAVKKGIGEFCEPLSYQLAR